MYTAICLFKIVKNTDFAVDKRVRQLYNNIAYDISRSCSIGFDKLIAEVKKMAQTVKNTEKTVVKVDYTKKLPDAEFDVMNAIWNAAPPVNTAYLMEKVGNSKGWKAPTLISFLVRLEERGYISSTKHGKERFYMPEADKIMYMQAVTEDFVERYHGGSFVSLMDTLYHQKVLSEKDIDELLEWLKTKY